MNMTHIDIFANEAPGIYFKGKAKEIKITLNGVCPRLFAMQPAQQNVTNSPSRRRSLP